MEKWLRHPYYPLLLGRSNDLIFIKAIKTIEVKPIKEGLVENTIVPKESKIEEGTMVRLPISMSLTKPRELESSEIFFHIKRKNLIETSNLNFFEDPESQLGFFLFP